VPVVSRQARLLLTDKTPDNRDLLVWKWIKGQTMATAFGDPLGKDGYTLCIYDESGDVPRALIGATAPAGGTCGTKPCWRPQSTKGFKYKNWQLTPDGLLTVFLRAGESDKAKIIVTGRGANLRMPALPLSLPLRVQLLAENGQCWEAEYAPAGVRRNNTKAFDATAN
jgi:hypothetical protein